MSQAIQASPNQPTSTTPLPVRNQTGIKTPQRKRPTPGTMKTSTRGASHNLQDEQIVKKSLNLKQ